MKNKILFVFNDFVFIICILVTEMKLGGLRYECFEESPNYQPGDEKFN